MLDYFTTTIHSETLEDNDTSGNRSHQFMKRKRGNSSSFLSIANVKKEKSTNET